MTSHRISPGQLELSQPIIPEMRMDIRNWANEILMRYGIMIRSIRNSCSDGVVFLYLLEDLIGRDIGVSWNPEPATIAEKWANVDKVLRFLNTNRILESGVVTSDDVIWGEERFSFYVLRRIHRRFRVGRAINIIPLDESMPGRGNAGQTGSKLPPPVRPAGPSKRTGVRPDVPQMPETKRRPDSQESPVKRKNRVFDIGNDRKVFKWEKRRGNQPSVANPQTATKRTKLPGLSPQRDGKEEKVATRGGKGGREPEPGPERETDREPEPEPEPEKESEREPEKEPEPEPEKDLEREPEPQPEEEPEPEAEKEPEPEKDAERAQDEEEEAPGGEGERELEKESEPEREKERQQEPEPAILPLDEAGDVLPESETEEVEQVQSGTRCSRKITAPRAAEWPARVPQEREWVAAAAGPSEAEAGDAEGFQFVEGSEIATQTGFVPVGAPEFPAPAALPRGALVRESELGPEPESIPEAEQLPDSEAQQTPEPEEAPGRDQMLEPEPETEQTPKAEQSAEPPDSSPEVDLVDEAELAEADAESASHLALPLGPVWNPPQKEAEPAVESGDATPEVLIKVPSQRPVSPLVVGIDVGTSGVRYAVCDGAEMDARVQRSSFSSSVIHPGEKRLIGEDPAKYSDQSDVCVVHGTKRLIGREFSDISDAVSRFGFPMSTSDFGHALIRMGGETYSPQEVTAWLLQEVRDTLGQEFQEDIVDAVIAVPGCFSSNQKKVMLTAARDIAGFNVIRLRSEPMAALLALAVREPINDGHIVVVDFGAGKFEILLVRKESDVCTILKTTGDAQFGGLDLDNAIADVVFAGSDIPRWRQLFECRKAREYLSANDEAIIQVGDFQRPLTRVELNSILEPSYDRLWVMLGELFENEEVLPHMIDHVVLVGGMAQVREVQEKVGGFFAHNPAITITQPGDVAFGAAYDGAAMKGLAPNLIKIRPTTPLSIGISLANGTSAVLIRRGTALPVHTTTITTTSRDGQSNVGFDVIEGERPLARDNVLLANVVIHGIEPAAKGVPRIEVSIDVDEDGIVNIMAKELRTGAARHVTVQTGSLLSEDDVQSMLREANNHREEDRAARKRAVWRSKLFSYVRQLDPSIFDDEERQREFADQIVIWKQWNADHENEESADVYVRQMREVATRVQNSFSPPTT
jgi:molecular chaperone DnaK